jgi:pimeloyl-ACP methyl ester carboxylesterase
MHESALYQADIQHTYAEVNGVRLHYAHTGQGPLMVFLHGFPQCWHMWRYQLAEFAQDHLVVAPDLRGFNLSSKPKHLHEYGPWAAAQDIRALIEHLGRERLVLVGHDWGAATAWTFALHHPDLLDALVILATPHPATFDTALHNDPEQQQASQYLLGLRRPDVEPLLAENDCAALRATLDQPFLDTKDQQRYLESWRQPDALTGMLSWYRREGLGPPEDGTPARGNYAPQITPLTVSTPTLVVYPSADIYTRPAAHQNLGQYVPDLTYQTVEGASHWIAEEHPKLVNRQIRDFLASRSSKKNRPPAERCQPL